MVLGINLYTEFWVEPWKRVTGGTFIKCSTKNQKGFSYGDDVTWFYLRVKIRLKF